MYRDCSICSAPVEVVRAINSALAKREKMRDIAARSGFSKSAIHRHSQRCVPREIISAHKSARFDARTGRVFVSWPDDPSCPADTRGKLLPGHRIPGEHDVMLHVQYEKPIDYDPRIQSPTVAFDLAIEENQLRNIPVPDPEVPTNGKHTLN